MLQRPSSSLAHGLAPMAAVKEKNLFSPFCLGEKPSSSILGLSSLRVPVTFTDTTQHCACNTAGHQMCEGFSPRQAILCDTSVVPYNLTQF